MQTVHMISTYRFISQLSNSFLYERFCTKTRFETEAEGNIHLWAAQRSLWFFQIPLLALCCLVLCKGFDRSGRLDRTWFHCTKESTWPCLLLVCFLVNLKLTSFNDKLYGTLIKVPMKWKIICAYLKGLSKYRRLVFFFQNEKRYFKKKNILLYFERAFK